MVFLFIFALVVVANSYRRGMGRLLVLGCDLPYPSCEWPGKLYESWIFAIRLDSALISRGLGREVVLICYRPP